MVAPFLPDDVKLAAVREALPAVGAGIYLDTPVAGPLPAETARSMADLAGWEATTGRAGRDRREEALSRVDEARGAVAAILTTDVDNVVLTHGLHDAVVIAGGGDPMYFDVQGKDAAEQLPRVLAREPRLVVVPHVDPLAGGLLPVRDIARVVHEHGSLVLVDGSQAAGAIPVAVDDLEADFYAVPASTWLLGPEGIGALAAAPSKRGRLLQARHGAGTLAPVGRDVATAFDFHLPSVVGFGRSCGWLSMYVGLDWIHARAAALARRALDRLGAIDGVEVLTPLPSPTTIVSFRVGDWTGERLLEELGARVFAIASVVPRLNAVRIGTGFFNTEDEIDRFLAAVALLAAHTPETMPPRRRLTVLGGTS